jgi:hypothetical protein
MYPFPVLGMQKQNWCVHPSYQKGLEGVVHGRVSSRMRRSGSFGIVDMSINAPERVRRGLYYTMVAWNIVGENHQANRGGFPCSSCVTYVTRGIGGIAISPMVMWER